ncbi:MAG: L,D-transpeptidase [Holophagales bacterium]|nr:L,D-transpeptidase [Holophagales bacterium]
MTAIRIRIYRRPATGTRRRSFLLAALVVCLGVSYAAGAYDAPPNDLVGFAPEPARAAAARASRTLEESAPATARHVERLVSTAEIATAAEVNSPIWQRTPGRAQEAWSRALLAAHEGLVDLRRRESVYDERWRLLAVQVEGEVARALAESQEAGVGRREIAAANQAKLKWTLARRFADDRGFERAIAEAEQARVLAATVHESYRALHSRFSDPKNLRHWRSLVAATIDDSKSNGETALIVDKLARKLHVYRSGRRVASYAAELGAKGLKQKLHSGDQATPEGRYRVREVRGPQRTNFYKALLIDYPNEEDRARYEWGKRTGQVPRRTGIGSLIEIHGDGGQGRDWTDGCVALRNSDMDRVFDQVRVGTPVTIVGTF